MDIRFSPLAAATVKIDCIAVAVFQDTGLSDEAKTLDKALKGSLQAAVTAQEIAGKVGDCLVIRDCHHAPARRVVLVGLGKAADYKGFDGLRLLDKATLALSKTLLSLQCTEAAVFLPVPVDIETQTYGRSVSAALVRASYRFLPLKSTATPAPAAYKLKRITLALPPGANAAEATQGALQGQALAQGEALARDLGNTPPNICTPKYLGDVARRLAKDKRIKVDVLERKQIEALKMGAFLAVAKGSDEPPRFIVIQYNGSNAAGRKGAAPAPYVLVGKGITFDSGGISLKPGLGMDEMKFDMCGAASVLGTLQAVAALNLPLNVVGVVVASENMPNGRACKPGDVVTSMSGQTIEILNTDAEGRLVLCDALTYVERFKPAVVVDIATLTGACVTALGSVNSGLFSDDDALVVALQQASRQACDPTWHMPLTADYQEQLHSNFADMANIGGPPAGAVTAACFLARYTKAYRWAHLDIAGVAWKGGAREKGSTGRPVPLLLNFLLNAASGTPLVAKSEAKAVPSSKKNAKRSLTKTLAKPEASSKAVVQKSRAIAPATTVTPATAVKPATLTPPRPARRRGQAE